MLKMFNSLQIVAVFVAWPFLIGWLSNATFQGAFVAFLTACVLYLLGFFAIVGCVYAAIERE